MDIQELIKQHTNDEGLTDFNKVNQEVQLHIDNTSGTTVASQTSEFKAEMEALKSRNLELENMNKSLSSNDDFYKNKIKELTEENNVFKGQKSENNFRDRANKLGVSTEIQEQFINSGANLDNVNLTAFQNTATPEQIEDNKKAPTKNGGNDLDELFSFVNDVENIDEANNENGGNE